MQDQELKEPIKISVIDLVSAYSDNPESAESKFKERKLRVYGIVDTSGRNSRGRLFATLEASGLPATCYFIENESSRIEGLISGQTVVVEGVNDSAPFLVSLKGCVLVDVSL